MKLANDPNEFVEYLQETLIPAFKASGNSGTAKDFEKAVAVIDDLQKALLISLSMTIWCQENLTKEQQDSLGKTIGQAAMTLGVDLGNQG